MPEPWPNESLLGNSLAKWLSSNLMSRKFVVWPQQPCATVAEVYGTSYGDGGFKLSLYMDGEYHKNTAL